MREGSFKTRFKSNLASVLDSHGIDFEIFENKSQRRSTPDTIILAGDRWAMLEFKKSEHAPHQPNQDYYVTRLGAMSYASFVYPENAEEVLYELEELFTS